eukprot:TRINITY_DN486_c1_g1_i1.p1 TRINITY_DN486_c1_g1~~TRINITY_DN486_c1_g1_i1.p1  ORF type:complete len:171 (-),score=33.48 TRINITY_DN486_c1_g1_i1:817-1329(-)
MFPELFTKPNFWVRIFRAIFGHEVVPSEEECWERIYEVMDVYMDVVLIVEGASFKSGGDTAEDKLTKLELGGLLRDVATANQSGKRTAIIMGSDSQLSVFSGTESLWVESLHGETIFEYDCKLDPFIDGNLLFVRSGSDLGPRELQVSLAVVTAEKCRVNDIDCVSLLVS